MAENSNIEWTDHTFNPWIGCAKVSDGCKHCYAETMMDQRYGRVKWGPQGTRQRTSDANWRKPLSWNRKAKANSRRYFVFCASLADVFEDRPEVDPWRVDLFRLIETTPNLDWLLLTKRPENVMGMIARSTGRHADAWLADNTHAWIGASVENQKTADERIPHLLHIPASVRFLSMEPLLGPVSLDQVYDHTQSAPGSVLWPFYHGINWVIVGGESGPSARPMHPEWVRDILDQCVGANIPFFFKQWGEWLPSTHVHPGNVYGKKHTWAWPWASGDPGNLSGDTTMMVRVGKNAAGRRLDGREWYQWPLPNSQE